MSRSNLLGERNGLTTWKVFFKLQFEKKTVQLIFNQPKIYARIAHAFLPRRKDMSERCRLIGVSWKIRLSARSRCVFTKNYVASLESQRGSNFYVIHVKKRARTFLLTCKDKVFVLFYKIKKNCQQKEAAYSRPQNNNLTTWQYCNMALRGWVWVLDM